MILHPFMSSAWPKDPPRVLPVQQYDIFVEPDVHQQPVAATTPDEADADAHHLGHAVLINIYIYIYILVSCVSYFLFFSILLLTIAMFVFFHLLGWSQIEA